MTYSIVARCGRTGQLGAASVTSDIAVGARVPWAAAGVGAVVTQHRTDPRLGPRMLGLLRLGATAGEAVTGAMASTGHAAWRQLAAIGTAGPGAVRTGDKVAPDGVAEVIAADHAVAGNILASPEVGRAASTAFAADPAADLSLRLIAALDAGLAAGGEPDPLRSAALIVVAGQPFPLIDLRVDEHAEPLAELRRLHALYHPAIGEYVRRALSPDAASGNWADPS
jgi:uncharacterized Ntn-hydrolase superfamily protein